jgi:hypothetical protein
VDSSWCTTNGACVIEILIRGFVGMKRMLFGEDSRDYFNKLSPDELFNWCVMLYDLCEWLGEQIDEMKEDEE